LTRGICELAGGFTSSHSDLQLLGLLTTIQYSAFAILTLIPSKTLQGLKMGVTKSRTKKTVQTRKFKAAPSSSSSPLEHLKLKFAITPKTASLLVRLGYANYRDLRYVSPNHVLTQLKALHGVTPQQAEQYRRALRRMVWLGTQDNPEEQAKRCKDWSQKALTAKGVWSADYDDLTGDQAESRFQAQGK
jgi:hypothetical protein